MKKITCLILLFMFLCSINIVIADVTIDENTIFGVGDKRVILWNFDDIRIDNGDDSIGTVFRTMSDNVTVYDGYVGWGFIPGSNDSSFYYTPLENVTYTATQITEFNTLMNHDHIFLYYHDWNHSFYVAGHSTPWNKSVETQRSILNYTVWTFYNNFGYNLDWFMPGGDNGNYGMSFVLAERNLFMTNMKTDDPVDGIRSLDKDLDSNCDVFYIANTSSLATWKNRFNQSYDSYNHRVIRIGVHPSQFDGNADEKLKFQNFVQWIYDTHNLINMDFNDAYRYLKSPYHIRISPSTTMTFDEITIGDTWVELNNIGFNVSSSNPINLSVSYLNDNVNPSTYNTKVLEFTATTTGSCHVYINLTGFPRGAEYRVYRDGSLFDTVYADSSETIYMEMSDWSSHTLTIRTPLDDSTEPGTTPSPQITYVQPIIYVENHEYQPVSNAQVTIEGVTKYTDSFGEARFRVPTGIYDISIEKNNDIDYNTSLDLQKTKRYTITLPEDKWSIDDIDVPGIPGFELLNLIAALGTAFILLRRRR